MGEPKPGDAGVQNGGVADVARMDWRAIGRRVINCMTPFQWVLFGVLMIFCTYKIRESWQIDDEIEKYAAETPGILVDYHRSGGSDRTSVFEYWVDGRKYTTYAGGHRFGECVRTRHCIGVHYVIRYSSIHPEKGKVLWEKPVPRLDSLQHQRSPWASRRRRNLRRRGC